MGLHGGDGNGPQNNTSRCYKYIDVLKYVALGFKQVYVVQSDIL